MTTSAPLCVLALLSAATLAHGAEPGRTFEDEAWAWFADQLGAVDDRSALQAHLPDVHALDIAWTQSPMGYDRAYLAFPGTTADNLLAPLDSQLARKAWAEAGVTSLALLFGPENAVESREEAADLDRALWAHLHRTGTMEALGLRADGVRETGVAPAMLAWVQHAAPLDAEAMARFHVSAHDLVHMTDYQLIRKVRTDAYVAALASRIRCPGAGAGTDRDGARPALRQRLSDEDAAGCDAADAFCRLSPFTGRLCTAADPGCRDGNAIRARPLDASGDARGCRRHPVSGAPDDLRDL